MPRVEYCLLKRALAGFEDECGDTGVIMEYDDKCFFALIDGLGHGREACEAATLAESFLLEDCSRDLVAMMKGLHLHLGKSRGAVAVLCRLDIPSGVLH